MTIKRTFKQKAKQTVKQSPTGSENKAKNKWQRRDLNPRPKAYESSALPLSYAASSQNIA